ncbi:MAG: carbohydrate porin [Phycisphaerales bacterium]|nr:carbohydrate porin [Phycisphaerales bacterium]
MTGDWGGLRTELRDIGIDWELTYQQQFQQNYRGGLQTHNGHRLSGTYDWVLRLDFEKIGLMPDAGFYFKAKGGYSDGINPHKVGASSYANVNSDVGGDKAIYVNKWWFWKKFADKKIELRLGVLELNKDLFDVSPYANHEDRDFLNRLSIRNPTIPLGTGMGAFVKIEPVDWFYFQSAAIDTQARKYRTQFDTAFHDEAWYTGLWEMGVTPKWSSAKGPMPGNLRVGWWYNPTFREVFKDTMKGLRKPEYRGDDVGFYLGADQLIWKENDDPKDKQGLGWYGRYGCAHGDINKISDYWATGLSYTGLLPGRDKDVFAFGVSQAIPSGQYRREKKPEACRETVYEWFYKCYVTPWFIVSPDLQVVVDPGGTKSGRDAIVGGVRIQLIF